MSNSNKAILKIDEQIQSLKDAENRIIKDTNQENDVDNPLKTDTREITSIQHLETNCDSVVEATKKIDVLKFLDQIIPLSKIQNAFEELTSGKSSTVKIIIDHNK